jgi:Animal haem peroxidase
MAADGRLAGRLDRAMVAGDVRANENIARTATHTLFAREHNRIVAALPPEPTRRRSSRSPAGSSALSSSTSPTTSSSRRSA